MTDHPRAADMTEAEIAEEKRVYHRRLAGEIAAMLPDDGAEAETVLRLAWQIVHMPEPPPRSPPDEPRSRIPV
jgi:hypothetical protein